MLVFVRLSVPILVLGEAVVSVGINLIIAFGAATSMSQVAPVVVAIGDWCAAMVHIGLADVLGFGGGTVRGWLSMSASVTEAIYGNVE